MPAGLKFQSKFITLLCLLTVMLLSACSRNNPLSVPEKYIETSAGFCIENGPYSSFKLLESIDVTNIDGVPENYPEGYDGVLLEAKAPFLLAKSKITVLGITDFKPAPPSDAGEREDILVVLTKTINNEIRKILSDEIISEIESFEPEVNTISVTVEYQKDDQKEVDQLGEDLSFVTTDLVYGKNNIIIRVSANIKVLRTAIDCQNPLTSEEMADEDFETNGQYKNVNVSQIFNIEVDRSSFEDFVGKELNVPITLTQNDQFGRILSINDEFLVIGSPNEDSLSQGIISSASLLLDSITPNEDALNSGAVYVYKKMANNTWDFHSFIKSSNNEQGDLFGTDVALSGNTLAISAPGEDSSASGVFQSTSLQIDNYKLNNLASSSGAVYIYEYDEGSDSWLENYYIKPEYNVISGGNYNKGFGSQLAINGNKLLIGAPFEDSTNGNSTDSSYPDSGAVYSYKYSLADKKWSFLTTLKAFNPTENDNFGSIISISDRFIAIGAPFEDNGSKKILNNILEVNEAELNKLNSDTRTDSGAVYIYSYSQATNPIKFTTYVKSTNSDRFDYFGSSVSITDSFLLVGATGEDSSGRGLNRDMETNDLEDSGAVYLFKYNSSNGLWSEDAFIKATDSQSKASFGKYIDFNDENIVISAPLFDSILHENTGKAYYYTLQGANVFQNLDFEKVGGSNEERFGSGLSVFGRNLAIGASGFVDSHTGLNVTFAGKVFTFE